MSQAPELSGRQVYPGFRVEVPWRTSLSESIQVYSVTLPGFVPRTSTEVSRRKGTGEGQTFIVGKVRFGSLEGIVKEGTCQVTLNWSRVVNRVWN